jgi:hypothetical protein
MKLNYVKYLFGWKEVKLPYDEPCIVVYAHTSYWDAFFYFLYRISSYGENMYTLVQPKLSKWYYRPFALLLNMIFAPPVENRNNNTLNVIIKTFSDKPTSKTAHKILVLSPKGTCSKKEWRSGYYYIAKELNYKIYPLCIDYTNRTPIFGNPVNPNTMSLDECTINLQKQLGQYRGLNLENAEFEITDNCGCPYECLFPFDFCMATTYLFIPFLLKLLENGSYYRFTSSFILFIFSLIYHHENEGVDYEPQMMQLFQQGEGLLAKVMIISHIIENLYKFGHLNSIFYFTLIVGLFFYKNGTPRGNKNRGKYVVFHSIHHILFAIWAYSLASQQTIEQ